MSFTSLLNHFYLSTGIEFKDNKDVVKRKITRFYEDKGYKDYDEFFSVIKRDSVLHQDLVNLLTTSETYFYRELSQIELCISQLKDIQGNIKILSAPCASGEEPYSLLIAMIEAGISLSNISIYAIDINTLEIEKAKKGIFIHRRLHKLPTALQDKYFTKLANGDYQISTKLQSHIQFKQMNLFDNFPHDYNNFDIIFSRNMLIYFDKPAQVKAERIFYNKLKTGGSLFLGHADKIHDDCGFIKSMKQGTSFYMK